MWTPIKAALLRLWSPPVPDLHPDAVRARENLDRARRGQAAITARFRAINAEWDAVAGRPAPGKEKP